MKKISFLLVWLVITTGVFAQKADNIINAKEVERIERILSADDMQGRRTFTPGIEKAAAFIADEFRQTGLQTLQNSGTYLQSFAMLRPKFISASCSFDGVSVDSRDVIVVTCKEDLKLDETSGYEKVSIAAGANLFTEARKYINAKKNYLVLVDTSYAKTFNQLTRVKSQLYQSEYSTVFILAAADPKQAWVLGAETVERQLYWGAAVNPRDPGLTLERRGGHYVLNGRKTFSTGAHVSDRINVNAAIDGKIANFVVPTDRPGYVANDDWDNIGQRLSDSGSVEFRDFPVYERDFILPLADPSDPPPVQATFNTPLIQLVFVNFYLGTAEGALAAALDYVRSTTRPWITSGVERASDDPYILERIGELQANLKASIALAA